MKAIPLLIVTLALAACDNPPDTVQSQQLAMGKRVFEANCQECHGIKARGVVKDWQKPDTDGKYPAPPLNGSAHAWHHDMKTLLGTINRGGIPLGGTMPAFKEVLTEEEKKAVLAYIQSLWPKDIYDAWKERNG
ncbi:MAG: cytochrome c [Desulfobacterales bacterium]|nr:cytochrome c [Desulfobacterales bacterium]